MESERNDGYNQKVMICHLSFGICHWGFVIWDLSFGICDFVIS